VNRFFAVLREQRRAVLAVLVTAIAAGGFFAFRMPAAILPEVTFPRIKVIAESGERPGDEMLRVVTRPLEEQLRWVPDVREMRSTTARGSAEIHLDCAWNADMNLVLQRVQARMDAVRADLPAGTTLEVEEGRSEGVDEDGVAFRPERPRNYGYSGFAAEFYFDELGALYGVGAWE